MNGNIVQADQETSTDAGQSGGALTEGSQVVSADSNTSGVALAEEESADSEDAPAQNDQGDVPTLHDFEEQGNQATESGRR